MPAAKALGSGGCASSGHVVHADIKRKKVKARQEVYFKKSCF
jgi:hypothetical protein